MRLSILDTGYGFSTRAAIAVAGLLGLPALDVVKMCGYRRRYFGKHLRHWLHYAMRKRSEYTAGERELMVAFAAKLNVCEF